MRHYGWVDAGLTSPDFCSSDRFLDALALLREEDPVHWMVGSTRDRFGKVTSYAGCRVVLDNAQAFSSRRGDFMPLQDNVFTPEQECQMGVGPIPTHVDPHAGEEAARPLFQPEFCRALSRRDRRGGGLDHRAGEAQGRLRSRNGGGA